MDVITALIAGLLAGWLIEWIIDWIFWRRRQARMRSQLDRAYIKLGSADAASHALEHQLETLKGEHAALQSKYNALAARIADTQPLGAVKKADEEETWVEAAPAGEWKAEDTEVLPSAEATVSEIAEPPLSPEPESVETPAQTVPSGEVPEVPLTSEDVPGKPVQPVTEEPPALTETSQPALPLEPAPPAPVIPFRAEPAIPGLPEEPAQSDNLRVIKGIGPAIDYKLRQAGITTYKDLAESTPERVAEAIGPTFLRLVDVDALIEQARLLAASKDSAGQA